MAQSYTQIFIGAKKIDTNNQKWEILAFFFMLPYSDGFLGPKNLAILAIFSIFDPDSSRKILSKNQTYASIPAFFLQKMTRIGQFFPFYPILMAPLNQAILALF